MIIEILLVYVLLLLLAFVLLRLEILPPNGRLELTLMVILTFSPYGVFELLRIRRKSRTPKEEAQKQKTLSGVFTAKILNEAADTLRKTNWSFSNDDLKMISGIVTAGSERLAYVQQVQAQLPPGLLPHFLSEVLHCSAHLLSMPPSAVGKLSADHGVPFTAAELAQALDGLLVPCISAITILRLLFVRSNETKTTEVMLQALASLPRQHCGPATKEALDVAFEGHPA